MSASTNLALDIVLEEFGPTCHSVAEALTVLGASTIPDIVKYVSSLPNYASVEANVTTRVRAALASLVLHNLVGVRVRVRHKEAAGLLTSRITAPVRKKKRKDDADTEARAVISYPQVSNLDPSYSTSSLRYEFRPLCALRRIRNPKLIHIAAKTINSLHAEATTILMTLVKKGACHKLGVLECSIRVSQTKSKKALFTDDIEIYPEFPAEGHEDVDAEYTKEMATPEPPVTDSDIIAAAKELSLDKDFSSLQEYPFFSSLTARGKLALLRFERAWRDLLPLRFVVAAEGIAAPPFPQHFLASNIPPRQRFFASATESTATTATVAEKTAEVVAKSESTADVADDTVPTTKGARVTRKRKLSEISFSSDVSDVSEDENDAGSSTVPAKGSASSSNSDNPGTPASNGYTKMEGGNMSAMVGQYNLGNIYGESFDEDDYTQPVPGVASPSAASGVCAQKSNLWRFGWEAATAHMRNEILARYSGSLIHGFREDMFPVIKIVRALLFVAETKSSSKGKSTLVSSLTGNLDDDASTDPTCLTPPELSPPVSIREILAQLNKEGYECPDEDGWSAEKVRSVLNILIDLPNPHVQVDTYGEGGSLASLNTKVQYNYSKAILGLQMRSLQQWVQDKYLFLPPPSTANMGHASLGGQVPSVVSMGPLASRLLRLLLEKGGMLEEKQIADLLLIDQKTVKVILFRLFQDGLVSMVDVPKRPDRNPQTSLFLFEANWTKLLPLVTDLTHRSILNLRIRRRYEDHRAKDALRSHEELLNAIRADEQLLGAEGALDASGQSLGASMQNASKASEDMKNRIAEGVKKLEASIIRCDESLLVFSDLFPLPN